MNLSSHTQPQRDLLDRWIPDLEKVPSIDLVWLDGSLANNSYANPNSDIDIRIAIRDEDYDRIWRDNPSVILDGLGKRISLAGNWRQLTWDGVIVEIMAFRTSELTGMKFPDWEILFSRLTDTPGFQKLPERSPREIWPETEELSQELVTRWTKVFLLAMAHTPSVYFREETVAMRLQLDWMREELLKMIYRHLDLQSGVRPRHLSTVFPSEAMAELESTYVGDTESIGDTSAIASATVRTLGLIGHYLSKLDARAGGGFEAEWYDRMLGVMKERLKSLGSIVE